MPTPVLPSSRTFSWRATKLQVARTRLVGEGQDLDLELHRLARQTRMLTPESMPAALSNDLRCLGAARSIPRRDSGVRPRTTHLH